MISVQSLLIRSVATLEIILFISYLLWGSHGVRSIKAFQEKNSVLDGKIAKLEQAIAQTRAELDDWNSNPFYKEQYAREHLQMAHKDDEVYLY